MKAKVKSFLLWPLLAFFAIGVGLYPLIYFLVDMSGNLLGTKSTAVLNSTIWNISFYTHITLGGLALFVGWLQFSKKLRMKYIRIHRAVGYTYAVCVLLSGITGLYIACYATGGFMAKSGFFLLAVFWLLTTGMAIKAIRNKKIESHQYWMMRSYALTFAAVTLRLWLPTFGFMGWAFMDSYPIIAWLAWVPNIVLMELYICRKSNVMA